MPKSDNVLLEKTKSREFLFFCSPKAPGKLIG